MSATVTGDKTLKTQELPEGVGTEAKIGEKLVVKANNQTSKGWFILAIVIGSLVVIGAGGVGGMGLLQSHDLISLPQWLTSAVGTIGNTPHFWSLWAMTAGGIVIGGGLIAFGAYKVHQAKLNDKQLVQQQIEKLDSTALSIMQSLNKLESTTLSIVQSLEQFQNKQTDQNQTQIAGRLQMLEQQQQIQIRTLQTILYWVEQSQQPSMANFGDNFKALGIQSEKYSGLQNNTYTSRVFVLNQGKDEDPLGNFIIIRDPQGDLRCTLRCSRTKNEALITFLKDQGYKNQVIT